MNRPKQKWAAVLAGCVVFTTVSGTLASQTDQPAAQSTVQNAQQTQAQLQQLVAPIALYPDALVAQIVAAATYPDEIRSRLTPTPITTAGTSRTTCGSAPTLTCSISAHRQHP